MNANRPTAETLLAVLPITAIEAISLEEKTLLLVGAGSFLRAIDAETGFTLYNGQILLRQAIHGIVPLSCLGTENSRAQLNVIVYGGRQIAWIVADVAFRSGVCTCFSLNVIDRIIVRDWILSCKKSKSPELIASFVTSYNALYHVEANTLTKKLRCHLLTEAVGIFLYSADLTQRSEKGYLIASGTVFGQVLVWLCTFDDLNQAWSVSRCVQFNGHHGSIFGVNISKPHFLDGKECFHIVSCSDDRMIQVWRLSSIDFEVPGSVSDNFKQCDQAVVKTYGHISRIWNVDLVSKSNSGCGNYLLVSTGEDGQVQSWLLDTQSRIGIQLSYLKTAYIDRHHAGKNVWARCYSEQEGIIKFFTGGADDQIVSRRYDQSGRADIGSQSGSQSFKAIQSMIRQGTVTKKNAVVLKTYINLSHGYIMATTDAGQLVRGAMMQDPIEWKCVAEDPKGKPLAVSTTTVSSYAFFVRTSDYTLCAIEYIQLQTTEICSIRQAKISNIWAMNFSSQDLDRACGACIAVSYYGHEDIELYWIEMNQGEVRARVKSSVSLPATFEVTSILYDNDLQVLVYGSRAGAFGVSTNITSGTVKAETQICNRRIHSQDTVTSICKLRDDLRRHKEAFYLSTGGDGTYCIHKLDFDEARTPSLRIVHQASPPVGPRIEGASIINQHDGTQVILLHGFHSKNFVVWNETHQTQVMSVDCGGSHRSWMFIPDKTTGQGGVFVWTKAGSFMFHNQKTSDHEIIQAGGHGREIKALAIHQLGQHRWLLATGSEDTDIRLFEYDRKSLGSSTLRNVAVLRKHTTGLQDLQLSPDGKTLISAAGMEELYAWSLTPVPVIGQGVVFACALTSTDAQSDARIMSFDMRVQHEGLDGDNPSYLIVAAFSNGRLKTIQLNSATETTKAHFTILHQLDFGTICLTQAHLSPYYSLESQSDTSIVGATNGSIQICRVTPWNSTPDTTILHPPQPDLPTTSLHHRLHQNSVTALQAQRLTPTHQLLVTGGDDNALAITIVSSLPHPSTSASLPAQNTKSEHTFKSLLIPDAHAAALTALQILPRPRLSQLHQADTNLNASTRSDDQQQRFSIISAGNDQRLQLWDTTVDVARLQSEIPMSSSLDEVQVKWLGEWHTDVADISGIDVLEGSGDKEDNMRGSANGEQSVEVVVVGVGMEIVRLDLERDLEASVE